MCGIMVNPVMLIYTFFLDIVFVVNQAILQPVIWVLYFVTFGMINLKCLSNALDKSYEVLFEMQKLEAEGFRRMRTIS